jgi:hypothetical protein
MECEPRPSPVTGTKIIDDWRIDLETNLFVGVTEFAETCASSEG